MSDAVDAQRDCGEGAIVGDDSIDAKVERLHLGASSGNASGDVGEEKYQYRMNHKERGRFIVINNKTFLPVTQMNERSGTDRDAANLYNDFRQLGFSVTLVHNQTVSQMLQLISDASREDHSERDCFAVAVLSHGDEGIVYGTDGILPIDQFVQPIKHCQTLAGKPKIFIFQACRGNELDDGMVADDAISGAGDDSLPRRIPLEADFIYAYSTTPGYYSWRNSQQGSWFIQALHRMLLKYATKLDFARLLTRVSHEVAYEFQSNASQAYMRNKKQVPSIVSMLTKDLYFTAK